MSDVETHLPGLHRAQHSYLVLLQVGFTLPLLLPAMRCALTAPFHPYPVQTSRSSCEHPLPVWSGRFAFCGTFPEVTLAGRYPAPCFHGARTFLCQHGQKPDLTAAIRPTDMKPISATLRQSARAKLSFAFLISLLTPPQALATSVS